MLQRASSGGEDDVNAGVPGASWLERMSTPGMGVEVARGFIARKSSYQLGGTSCMAFANAHDVPPTRGANDVRNGIV